MKNQLSKLILLLLVLAPFITKAQDKPKGAVVSSQELADKLSNPVANMISVPFQNNSDWRIGENNGSKNTLNFQQVIPFKLSSNLNLITRYIIPIVDQRDVIGKDTHELV